MEGPSEDSVLGTGVASVIGNLGWDRMGCGTGLSLHMAHSHSVTVDGWILEPDSPPFMPTSVYAYIKWPLLSDPLTQQTLIELLRWVASGGWWPQMTLEGLFLANLWASRQSHLIFLKLGMLRHGS
jgi:hypothetical protein